MAAFATPSNKVSPPKLSVATADSITIVWDKISGAELYKIEMVTIGTSISRYWLMRM